MSFSIDLWNGVDIIREKYTTIRREFRSFVNFLIKYNTIEIQHCKNLDILYNEFKEKNNKTESIFESARISAINMIDIESQTRKIFIENTSNLIKNINLFLQDLKYPSNEIPDLSVNFNKDLDKLRMKQEIFYSQCKEMCSLISQLDLENKLNEKSNETKLEKILNKLLKSRDEYLLSINETNVKRRNFNKKVEKIMNKYEKEHKKLLKNFIENLTEFNNDKRKLIDVLSQKENYFFSEYFQKLKVEDEIFNFIVNNATKEFPMIQIEFTPFKKKDFEIFLNLKYQNKLKQNDLNKILTTIQNYFQKNNIFPLNFLQTGILKNVPKPQKENFFNTRKFSLFLKKSFTIENSNNNTKNNENDNLLEKEINIIKNYEFIKNTINELVTNNEVKLFENSYVIDADISKILNEPKKFDDINDKIGEFRDLLLNQKDEANLVYIEAFIKTLSYLRSKGRYSINDETYIIFSLLFFLLLKQNKNNDYILKNLLMLSQTFYKIEGGDKIYISESLKNKDLFKSKEIWHRCINYSLKLANKDFIANKNEYINKINKDAYSTVITYLCDLKFFTNDETVYNEVYEFYKKIYNLKEEDINTIVENSIKSRMKKKDKENETQKEENETKKEEKGIKTEENEIKKEEDETKKEKKEEKDEIKNEEKDDKNRIKTEENEIKSEENEIKKEEKEDKIEIKNEENEIKREEKEDKDEIKKEKKEEKDEIKNEEKDDKNGIKTEENEIKSEENEIKKEEKEDKNEIKKEENKIKKDENEIKIEEIEAKEEKEDKNDMKKEENKIENEEKEAKNEKKQNILNNIDNNIDFNIDNNTDNNENKKEIIETKDAVNNENNNNDKDIENINNIDSSS